MNVQTKGKKTPASKGDAAPKPASAKAAAAAADPNADLSGKEYEKALKKLHVELVKLQLWVAHTGAKVCILFEGRDGAGKGGTIKAITERVSPRVFRVVALPAPTEREKSQMYVQRYLPHLPAAGEVVIFDRSWYNRAGVERVMGFCTDEQVQTLPEGHARGREGDHRLGHHPAEVLAGGQPRGADAAPEVALRGRAQDLEAFADGPEVVQPLVRLFAGARRDVRRPPTPISRPGGWRRRTARRRVRLNIISDILKQHPVQGTAAREAEAAGAAEARRLRRAELSVQGHPAALLTRRHGDPPDPDSGHRRASTHPARRAYGAPARPLAGRRGRAPAGLRAPERRRALHALHARGSRPDRERLRASRLVSRVRDRPRGDGARGRRARHRRQRDRRLRGRPASCEFAITVASGFGGVGLATRLMTALIDEAKRRGLKEMEGFVLSQNQSMLGLAKRLGFASPTSPATRPFASAG